jgi:hypothetical protein
MRSERGKEIGRKLLKYVNCVAWVTIKLVLRTQVSWAHEVKSPDPPLEPAGRVTSTKANIAEGPRAKPPTRPAPPITTIFIANASSSVTGWSSLGAPKDRTRGYFFSEAFDRKPIKKNYQAAAPPRSGIPVRHAQNGLRGRDNRGRKSRSQCTDPEATHSRDDRGRDDGAHRDADTPYAIGITLIDTVRDQRLSQP